jgi:hypothetical protein
MAGYSIGFTLPADQIFRLFALLSRGEAGSGGGRNIVGFIIAAALATAIAVAVDLWLKDARDSKRHRDVGDDAKEIKASGWSYRGSDWIIVASTVVCAFTLFAMAAYAITAMVGERIALG